MVLAVGLDVVEVDRIRRALGRSAFSMRCFTAGERIYAGSGPEAVRRLAARFAAKEATFKALGLGASGLRWQEAEVVRHSGGTALMLTGSLDERFRAMGASRLHLSFSHGKEVAVAVVVVEA